MVYFVVVTTESCASTILIVPNYATNVGNHITWWRHQMETFSVLLVLCGIHRSRWIHSQKPMTRTFDVFFGKQLIRRWFETPSRSLWRHYYDMNVLFYHDVDEIFWPQLIRSLKLGHVTGQGSMSPTWVGRVSDLGKNGFHKKVQNLDNIAEYLIASLKSKWKN